jgi:hypothetical protein
MNAAARAARSRPMRACLLAVLAVSLFQAIAAAPPLERPGEAPAGPSYGVRPAHHADGARAGRLIAHALEVDTVVTDGVEIFNFTDEPARFEVYAADMVATSGGGVAPAPRDAEVTGPGTWIEPDQEELEVAPHRSVVVPVTIEVPQGTVPGEHVAALLVEPMTEAGDQTIQARARVALRVQLEVLGEIDLGVQLGTLRWRQTGQTVRFDLPVTNGGNVTVVVDGTVVITDRGAQPKGELLFSPAARTMAPDATTSLEAVWEDPPWFGRVTAQAVVDAHAGEREPVRFVGDAVTFWIVPWASLLAAFASLALLAAVFFASRDRRRAWRERRREERELLRDFRAERRARDAGEDRGTTERLPVG